MAQPGDTITYTYAGEFDDNDDLIPQQEDISGVDEVVVDFCDGQGGNPSGSGTAGGSSGRVEGVVADVSSYDTIYIWVGGSTIDATEGRYNGGTGTTNFSTFETSGDGGGSTEISVSNTNVTDSADEPFIAAAGGGGGGAEGTTPGGAGAREGGTGGEGVAPPLGGDTSASSPGGPGEAAVGDGTSVPILDSGTTIKGGGAGSGTNGEVQLSFQSSGGGLSPPDAPTNLSATQK